MGQAAIDIGITTPWVSEAITDARIDPLDEYRRRKHQDYDRPCAAANWQYRPLIVSSFGRAHPDSRKIIHKLAIAASKAFGGADVARIESAWWRNATTLIMERNARMVGRCLPADALPPIVSGVNEAAWDSAPPRRMRRGLLTPADALVAGADPPAFPVGS